MLYALRRAWAFDELCMATSKCLKLLVASLGSAKLAVIAMAVGVRASKLQKSLGFQDWPTR